MGDFNDRERKIAEREQRERIAELERALRRERERSDSLERRNELLEEAARRAYKMASAIPARARDSKH